MNLKLIQSFRGFAAMAVVAFHTSIGMADPRYFGQPVLTWLTWKMNLGVDFFFVLSGFIIALAHNNDLGQPKQIIGYFKKRLIRIYPIYWVYLTMFCALALAGFSTKATLPTNPV